MTKMVKMTEMIVAASMGESIRKQDYISTREAAKRLGVALSTVQGWVESGRLPAWKTAGGHRRIPADAVAAFNSQQQLSLASGRAAQTQKILIVEDDPVMRHLYRQQIEAWHLPVELLMADDGFSGLVLMGRHNPDLLIADLSMPGMDGVKMLRRIAAMDPNISKSVIVITALTPEEIAAKGGLPPDMPVYPKPVSFPVLRALVEFKLSKSKTA